MGHAMLLDCTLRDGAYLIGKEFGENNIYGIIDGLIKSRVDCIEIGFLQNEGYGKGKTVFRNSEDAKHFIPKAKQGALFCVLADYSRYSIDYLDEHTDEGIDAVRECFFKNERYDAIICCEKIKELGYKCFVQPVDILGYSDMELIELIQKVNEIEPYCFSIVDTFGSMFQEDLHRIFEIINHNLISTCKIGFHSHNNMQLSNALSQEFIRMSYGKREVIVDGTISGMGRGAGNTPTELIAEYMVSKLGYNYDMDAILDVIDGYMDNIKSRCTWGYSTPYFVAGCYSAHVNNVQYLTKKNSIKSKDIRYILNKIDPCQRKRYDYELLEKTYLEYLKSDINDTEEMKYLLKYTDKRNLLLLAPGNSINLEKNEIKNYIVNNNPVIINVNFIHDEIRSDFLYFSNVRRYKYWKKDERFNEYNKIITSNIKQTAENKKEHIIAFNKLIKCGWDNLDNSMILLLRLVDQLSIKSIAIAGFDGFNYDNGDSNNYISRDMEVSYLKDDFINVNAEIADMLKDYKNTRKNTSKIEFITQSRFANIF